MGNIAREVAEHLATSPDDRVWRQTLRAQLPAGTIRARRDGGHQNNVSGRVRDALREFETNGWVARDSGAVQILDRVALWDYSQRAAAIPSPG